MKRRLPSVEFEPSGGTVPRRVLVLRALQLGDMLCALPALRSLRAALPTSEIVLIGLPWARWFVNRYANYLDGYREFPGYPGLPERDHDPAAIVHFLADIQAERFDLAIQLHGSGPFVNPLTVLLGARECAGFFLDGDFCPDPERFIPWPDHGLEIHRLLRLTKHLGAPDCGDSLEFPIFERDVVALAAAVGEFPLNRNAYVCIHPGASVPERRWPVARFVEVARRLSDRGLNVVLTGTSAEAHLTSMVARELPGRCLDLAGRTDLGATGALIGSSRLLVTNDTGVSHIAAGLGVPSVVLSTGDNSSRWAPTDRRRHRVLCRGSSDSVSVSEAMTEAEDLLAGSYRTHPLEIVSVS